MGVIRLPYGQDVVLDLPIITASSQAFKTSPTSAAGDVKVYHDRLIQTNPSGKTIAFTSGGTYEIIPGNTITGATSTATAIVMGVRLTSGTWAGADAAGILFVRSDSGTFQAENLDVGSSLNVATIGAALDAAGLFKHVGLGMSAVGIPGSQLSGARGGVVFHDAAGSEWEDTAILFETVGHENAADPQGCVWTATGTADTGTNQTTNRMEFDAAPSGNASAPAKGFYFEVSSGTGVGQAGFVRSYTTGATPYVVPFAPLTTSLDATSVVKFYRDARSPVILAASDVKV